MDTKTLRPSEKTLIFIILTYLCLIYLPFIISRTISGDDFIKGDCYFYRAATISLVEDGDLFLENNVPDPLVGHLAIGKGGLVLVHPILLSLVSVPFYVLFGTPGLLLFNIIDAMILSILVFKFSCLFHDRIIAFITTILYATGTLLFDYVYNYSPDMFSTVLLLAGMYLVFRRRYYLGAFLLGLAIFAKLMYVPIVALTLLYVAYDVFRGSVVNGSGIPHFQNKAMVILTTGVFFIIGLIPFTYTNYLQFGSPIVTGYQSMAVRGQDGQIASVDHMNKFNQPLLQGTSRVLFDIGNGIILSNPVLLLAFAGVLWINKMKTAQDKAYLILLICIIQFFIIAKYDEWATSHFSNRFLMSMIALSSVFTSNFLSYLSQRYSTGFLSDSREA